MSRVGKPPQNLTSNAERAPGDFSGRREAPKVARAGLRERVGVAGVVASHNVEGECGIRDRAGDGSKVDAVDEL